MVFMMMMTMTMMMINDGIDHYDNDDTCTIHISMN